MNVKFILFCIASLGCLMMMYLWFSMHKSVIDSQLNDEQYLYRISSLKAEIDLENKAKDNLRRDAKDVGQSYLEKSIIYETMQKKSKNNNIEKVKLEKQIETLKADYSKVSKSHYERIQEMKSKADSEKSAENNEIEILLNDVKKLERERDELLAAQKKPFKKTTEPDQLNLNKPNEIVMQGKAPKLNKINPKNKENKKSNIQMYPDVPEAKVDKLHSSNDNIQDTQQKNALLNSDKIKSNIALITKKAENAGMKTHEEPRKDIPNKIEMQPKSPIHNVKGENINDEFVSKDEHFQKKHVNPKILPKMVENQDYFISKKNVKSVDELIKEEIDQQKSKDNMEAVHQLKPPRKEDHPRLKDQNRGNIAKIGVKNDIISEIEHDI